MFDKITMLGKVEMDKVLFRFEDEPIIFVCKNKSGSRFLCINTGYGFEPTWLIARSTRKTLLKMLMNEISVLDALSESDSSIFIVRDDADGDKYERMPFKEIDNSELPDASEKLDGQGLSEYIQKLENEEFSKEFMRSTERKAVVTSVIPSVDIRPELKKYSDLIPIKSQECNVDYAEG